MKLSQILSQVKTSFQAIGDVDNIEIVDIALDSRLVERNSIFFALQGQNQDGSKFIVDALKNGADVVVSSVKFDIEVPLILCDQPFLLLAEFLQIFYSPLPVNIYAITGTNGKTSTAEFTRQILGFLGKKSASIGSLGTITDVKEFIDGVHSDLTTPDLVSLYKNLYNLKKVGVDDVAIEASSIGLEQGRVAGLEISVGAFTNFSQDHLDYHKSMDDYFECKMILFEKVLSSQGLAVLNSDIPEFEKIKQSCEGKKIIEYGFKAHDLCLKKIEQVDFGQRIFFDFNYESYSFDLSMIADFQAFNVLCALGNILAKYKLTNEELKNLLLKFPDLYSAPGRMQRVAVLPNKAQIFIDHSHKPDALQNVLKLARRISKSRVLVLFGCGGNRDAKKRPIMGQIASELADLVIVTDDNPRKERSEVIRKEILATCDPEKTIEIDNRKVAIEKAVKMLQDGDVLILAGKGHEKYQIIGETKFEFDEEKIVRNVIA
jgi:UDP-N-acetylmuramoyl-L-alanyl-D-glutamate--2,6-diaminopimelate ligase